MSVVAGVCVAFADSEVVMAGIHSYDIIMLVILVWMTLVGLWKGLIHQVAAIVAIVLSLWVATNFADRLSPYLGTTEPMNHWIAMLILYAVTSLFVWLISSRVSSLIDRIRLGGLDHQMGALAGFFKGVMFCLVITFFVVTLSETGRQSVLESRCGACAATILQKSDQWLPEKYRGYLEKYITQFQEKLNDSTATNPLHIAENSSANDNSVEGMWNQVQKQVQLFDQNATSLAEQNASISNTATQTVSDVSGWARLFSRVVDGLEKSNAATNTTTNGGTIANMSDTQNVTVAASTTNTAPTVSNASELTNSPENQNAESASPVTGMWW